jgi:DNA-binding phage protein
MITRKDILTILKSAGTWQTAEQVQQALPEASDVGLSSVRDMIESMVKDRVLLVDSSTLMRKLYTIRPGTTRPELPLAAVFPGIATIENTGLGSGFLVGTAISFLYAKDFASRGDRIVLLLNRYLERARMGLEPPLAAQALHELIAMQNKTSHAGVHASVERIKELHLDSGDRGPADPAGLRYVAAETSKAVSLAISQQDPRLLPMWIIAHVPQGAEPVLALLSATRGTLDFSKKFLVRCSINIQHTELRRKQTDIASSLHVKVDTVRAVLQDLTTGGSLCDRGDARAHQLRIASGLKALVYTDEAIEVVCALRAAHALQGNMTQAAKYIGVSRGALDRWLSAYGLERLKGGIYEDCAL